MYGLTPEDMVNIHFLDPDRIKIICINEKNNVLKEFDFALIIQIYSMFDVGICILYIIKTHRYYANIN